MPPTGGPVYPLASVVLYDIGAGDPPLEAPAFGWYDLLRDSWQQGAFDYDALGRTFLEVIPDIGLTCRPFLVRQETQLAHYTVSGSWEQRYPVTGAPRVRWLSHYSTTADVTADISSIFNLPANPHFALSLVLADTPSDWNTAASTPRVRVQWGVAAAQQGFAVEFADGATYLQVHDGTAFRTVGELSAPASSTNGEQETPLWVRHLRGRVCISLDYGRTYTIYGSDAAPVAVPAAPYTVTAKGGALRFSLSQLRYYTGLYTSGWRETQESRVLASVTATPWGDAPAGTTITLTDAGVPVDRIAAYTAQLVPVGTSLGTPGWSVYHCPVLMAVNYLIEPDEGATISPSTTPWDTRLMMLEVDKPDTLGAGSARWRAYLGPGAAPNLAQYRFRKVQLSLGYATGLLPADKVSNVVFTGYIVDAVPEVDTAGNTWFNLEADNFTLRLRDPLTAWQETEVLALDGLTVNQASDLIFKMRGIPRNASYRLWHSWGNIVTLTQGTPEAPCELLRPGETPWETLERIQGYARLELAAGDTGILQAVPADFVSAVSYAMDTTETDLQLVPETVDHTPEYEANATRVVVTGTNANGARLAVWATNTVAELVTASNQFSPWRRTVNEELPGTVTPGQLLGHAQVLAYEWFGNRLTPTVGSFINTAISRRDLVTLTGLAAAGIPDGTQHVVRAVRHRYRQDDDGLAVLTTEWGLRLR